MASTSKDQQQTKDAYSRLNTYITTDRKIVNPCYLKLFIQEKMKTKELDFSSKKGQKCIENIIKNKREDILNSIYTCQYIHVGLINKTLTWVTKTGYTPLLLSAWYDAIECMKVLIKYGANINESIYNGIPIVTLCSNDALRVLLEPGADTGVCGHPNMTPLSQACFSGTEIVKTLAEHAANVNCSSNHGKTRLMQCKNGQICEISLQPGANIKFCDPKYVEALIEQEASVNCPDINGVTPLMLCQDADTMSLLINHGANVDTMDKFLQTALYYAVNGVFYKNHDKWNQLIIDKVPHEERESIINVLLAAGASEVYSPEQTQGLLLTFKKWNYTLAINTLLSRDWVIVNCKDPERGQTPLMLFARDGQTDFMDKTISHGALLDEVDLNGKTALMYGSMPRHQCSTVKGLLAAGADVNVCDHEGRNVLMFTCKSGCYNCTEKILARGSDIDAITDHGHTSMTYALTNKTVRSLGSFSNISDLVKLLLVNGATLDFCKFPDDIVRDIKKYYIVYDYIIFLYTMLLQYSCQQCVFRLVSEIRAITDNTHNNIEEFSVITKNKAADIASILQSQDNDTVGIAECYSMAFTGLLQQYPKEIRLEHIAAMTVREAYGIDYLRSQVERGEFAKHQYDIFVDFVSPE